MRRIFTNLGIRSESFTAMDRSVRRPRRARLELESLDRRQVPSALLASSAIMAINVVPSGPIVPATVAYVPSGPIVPATIAYVPSGPVVPATVAYVPSGPVVPATMSGWAG